MSNLRTATLVALANVLSDELDEMQDDPSIAPHVTAETVRLFDELCREIEARRGREFLVDNVVAPQ